jgi:hypothetical protein
MTRTLHTQPRSILAARRSATPHRARGNEPLAAARQARLIRGLGVDVPEDVGAGSAVRIRVGRCRPGYVHPLGRRQIVDALAFFGPLVSYGLRSVELRQSVDEADGPLVLARLMVPGCIVLFEQPQAPWEIRGELSPHARRRLELAGAMVDVGPAVTRVEWPGDSLARLMLFDGLLHEIGHHLVQHHSGKRSVRVMRTADHERSAERFADACQRAWADRSLPT